MSYSWRGFCSWAVSVKMLCIFLQLTIYEPSYLIFKEEQSLEKCQNSTGFAGIRKRWTSRSSSLALQADATFLDRPMHTSYFKNATFGKPKMLTVTAILKKRGKYCIAFDGFRTFEQISSECATWCEVLRWSFLLSIADLHLFPCRIETKWTKFSIFLATMFLRLRNFETLPMKIGGVSTTVKSGCSLKQKNRTSCSSSEQKIALRRGWDLRGMLSSASLLCFLLRFDFKVFSNKWIFTFLREFFQLRCVHECFAWISC